MRLQIGGFALLLSVFLVVVTGPRTALGDATVFPPRGSVCDTLKLSGNSAKAPALRKWDSMGWNYNENDDVTCLNLQTCPGGSALNFDGQKFLCVAVCSKDEQLRFKNGEFDCCKDYVAKSKIEDCPEHYVGGIYAYITYHCDDTSSSVTKDECVCSTYTERWNEESCPSPLTGYKYDEVTLDCNGNVVKTTSVDECTCPRTTEKINLQECEPGETGEIYDLLTKDCNGNTVSEEHWNTCLVPVPKPGQCTVGVEYYGIKESGNFIPCDYVEEENQANCKLYVCNSTYDLVEK